MGKSVRKQPDDSHAPVDGALAVEVRELCRLLARILGRGGDVAKEKPVDTDRNDETLTRK